VKNAVPNINVLKRAALRDKALGALRDLASGAQFIDQVNSRHVNIVIGIRPDLVKSLISLELDCTRASLRVATQGKRFPSGGWHTDRRCLTNAGALLL
jgi:hypothetical protein